MVCFYQISYFFLLFFSLYFDFITNLSIFRKPEYIIYASDPHISDRMDFAGMEIFHPRGSIKSLRKGSYEIRSINSDG